MDYDKSNVAATYDDARALMPGETAALARFVGSACRPASHLADRGRRRHDFGFWFVRESGGAASFGACARSLGPATE
jgi:hypothetical protein